MIFTRLIWSSLAVALAVGTVQTGVQLWQAAPLIRSAEVYEGQKAEISAPVAAPVFASVAAPEQAVAAHPHAPGTSAHEHPQAAVQQQVQAMAPVQEHEHGAAKEWEPDNGAERIGWTWVANTLHAFSMALLVFAIMGVWRYQRGTALTALQLAGFVAGAGWLSFYLWPTLGLPAEVPGMDAAPLHARQLWWILAVGSAGMSCALMGFAKGNWRWPAAAVLLALPVVGGAPHLQGDALAGFNPIAKAALGQMVQQFAWATTWVAVSFWLSMGLACGLAFQRWLQPVLMANFTGTELGAA
jgi:cobalt transporter subunit CbtA